MCDLTDPLPIVQPIGLVRLIPQRADGLITGSDLTKSTLAPLSFPEPLRIRPVRLDVSLAAGVDSEACAELAHQLLANSVTSVEILSSGPPDVRDAFWGDLYVALDEADVERQGNRADVDEADGGRSGSWPDVAPTTFAEGSG